MSDESVVFLSLGSNLGDRRNNIERALNELEKAEVRIESISNYYETEPVGYEDQPWFFNIAAKARTSLEPGEFHALTKKVEKKLSGPKEIRWGPRLVDIDILLFNGLVIDTDTLKVPHPSMNERAFVIVPLLEIAPEIVLPDGTELKAVASVLRDKHQVKNADRKP